MERPVENICCTETAEIMHKLNIKKQEYPEINESICIMDVPSLQSLCFCVDVLDDKIDSLEFYYKKRHEIAYQTSREG